MHFSADKRNHPNKQTPRHLAVLSLDTSAGFSCPHLVNQFQLLFWFLLDRHLLPSAGVPTCLLLGMHLSPHHIKYLVREKEIDYLIELSKCKKHPQTLRPWPLSHLPIHPAFSVFPLGSSPFVRSATVCQSYSSPPLVRFPPSRRPAVLCASAAGLGIGSHE